MAESVMKVAEVAKRLKCSKDKVVHLIQTGRLAALDLGTPSRHNYRVTEAQYAAFETTPSPPPAAQLVIHEDNELVVGRFLGKRRR